MKAALPSEPIRSAANPRLKLARQLGRSRPVRQAEGLFLVEGAKLVLEAHQAGRQIEAVFVDRDALSASEEALIADLPGVLEVAPGLLERIGSAVSPQPVLAIAEAWSTELSSLPAEIERALLLVGIADPGNAGALLRTAEGSGIDAVVFAGDCVDPYNPKVVRAAAGSLFRCPFAVSHDVEGSFAALADRGLRLIGTASGKGDPHFRTELAHKVAIVLGNESRGLGPEIASLVDGWVHVPTRGSTESLNVAMAGTVLCFEGLRQETMGSGTAKAGSLSDP